MRTENKKEVELLNFIVQITLDFREAIKISLLTGFFFLLLDD